MQARKHKQKRQQDLGERGLHIALAKLQKAARGQDYAPLFGTGGAVWVLSRLGTLLEAYVSVGE